MQQAPAEPVASPSSTIPTVIGKYRWVICGLLFFATTINYIDRNSLSVLKTTLQSALGWTDVHYGWVTFAFTAAYAAFPSIVGTAIDRFGVKASLAGALILWSLMAAAHGLAARGGYALDRREALLRRGFLWLGADWPER